MISSTVIRAMAYAQQLKALGGKLGCRRQEEGWRRGQGKREVEAQRTAASKTELSASSISVEHMCIGWQANQP